MKISALLALVLSWPVLSQARVDTPAVDESGSSSSPATDAIEIQQVAFRVRSEFQADLNADSGWAAGVNEPAVVQADEPFRIRFEVQTAQSAHDPVRFGLQFRRNGGQWAPVLGENFPQPEKIAKIEPRDESADVFRSSWVFVEGGVRDLSINGKGSGMTLGHNDPQASNNGEHPVLAFSTHTPTWEPTEFASELHFSSPGELSGGLAVHYHSPQDYVRVELANGKALRVVELARGRASVLADVPVQFETSEWIDLVVKLDGSDLNVEINGEELLSDIPLNRLEPRPALGLFKDGPGFVEFRNVVMEGEPASPMTSIVAARGFSHGAQTEDVLDSSDLEFVGGSGASFSSLTKPVEITEGHIELEFPLVIRMFSDGAVRSESGDFFEYRLVDEHGNTLSFQHPAAVELYVPDYHLGGTFVETPMRMGPWQSADGSLYFLMEPAETWNALMVVRSTDKGKSWREIDPQGRPETGDLEGLGSFFDGRSIHIFHQTSDEVVYHVFDTSANSAELGAWVITDELVETPTEPPTQVADIGVLSDGTVVGVFADGRGLKLKTRERQGGWNQTYILEQGETTTASGPSVVVGKDDVVHIVYTLDNGQAIYRQFVTDTGLAAQEVISGEIGTGEADVGALLPLLYHENDNSVSVIYRAQDQRLYERRRSELGHWRRAQRVSVSPVVQNAVDSDQVGADAISHNGRIHLLFVHEDSRQLFYTRQASETWSNPVEVTSEMNVQWVRGALIDSGGRQRYGFVLDAGSDGGSGMNKYREIELTTP
ncbi:MAG: hypothetical protein V2J20_08980 [Wenzhouxiangella sp.]|nr:hypothetical protein [Wenzhouxiangella sp.]